MLYSPDYINRCWCREIMEVILNAEKINELTNLLATDIVSDTPENIELAIIGIRSRGEILAQRLCEKISTKLNKQISCGTLDITLYRDDLNDPQTSNQPFVRSTEINFDINKKIIILVDDVLHTGRSARAAMDALIDLGRPKALRLAVLIDRTEGREFPIQADYVGQKVLVKEGQSVQVNFTESDEKDQVVIVLSSQF